MVSALRFQLVIEPVSPKTAPLARDLILEGLKERFGWLNPTLNPDLQDILRSYTHAGHLFLVGSLNNAPGEVICTGALTHETTKRARIMRVSVKKDCRRKGFATTMVSALETHARETGMREIEEILLETTDTWKSAIDFYLALGYRIYEYSEGNCHMKKRLSK